MIVKHLTTGPLQVNTYIVGDDATRDAVIIDPGGNADEILRNVQEAKLTLRRIINTHAHFDHVGGVAPLKEAAGVPFALHRAELPLLENYRSQLAYFGISAGEPPAVDEYLEEGQEIEVGEIVLRVLFTPGHSPGHVTFLYDPAESGGGPRVAFSGDVLFRGGIGRTDLPGGDHERLMRSIREELFPLGDETTVYPGHGSSTTIGREKRTNPFL
ncbi:MAG: Hydroxyacylglutathione hydrolase GloC [Anaerolineales bacterium]|nr:Hydroxyacylglutathione hydrolase GloC [Anaerolineales bacterium]